MRKSGSHNLPLPGPGEGMRGTKGHIGYLLRQAHAVHKMRMEHALKTTGLTLPQFSVLTMLAAYPGASGAELARLSLLTPQTMSVIVSNLERASLIHRRPHEEHGRIQIIGLTDEGQQVLTRSKAAVKAAEAGLLADLSSEDEGAVRRWLVKVATLPTDPV